MNNKININPSSTKWLEKDDRVVSDYFCDLGFRSLKQILDMRVFDLMNMQGLNAVRVEEVIKDIFEINFDDDEKEEIYKEWKRTPIRLFINSYGGSVYDGLALIDVIRRSKTPVHAAVKK